MITLAFCGYGTNRSSHCCGCVLDVLCGFLFMLFLLAVCPAIIICLCFFALTTLIRNVLNYY